VKHPAPVILVLTLSLFTLTACGTVTQQINAVHLQVVSKIKTDIASVKEVGVASKNQKLIDCADAVLADQLPPLEDLDKVQVTGIFSSLALADAKHEALKIKPSVAEKCSFFGWMLGQLGLLGQAVH